MVRMLMIVCTMFAIVSTGFAQDAAPNADDITLTEVASGFTRPLLVTHAGDNSGRLFLLEQGGIVWIIENGARLDAPFLNISALVSPEANGFGYSERGLLGLAFAPDYEISGVFYVNYTDVDGNTVVARYRVSSDNANAADPNSAETILTQPQPYANHNGGNLAFGPDGYLYIGFGDGGSQGDPQSNGQNLSTWLGKILRVDVSTDVGYEIPADNPFVNVSNAMPEIWAYGVRNPWRFTFDRDTGDLYIGDVGGDTWEEISYQPADFAGGANYGWSLYEGNELRAGSTPADLVLPIFTYSHSEGISVTGGYVYRGSNIPALQGVYLYSDFGFGTVWAGWQNADGSWSNNVFLSNTGLTVSSFGQDEAGELYIINYAGSLLRIDPRTNG